MSRRILLIICTVCFSMNSAFSADQSNNSPARRAALKVNTHPKNWKNAELSTLLKTGEVISMRPVREYLYSLEKKAHFDGDVFFVELDNGLKAVFKSLPKDDLGDAYAEVAAYQASVTLGFPLVPPTVMADIKGMKGSLQLFVETDIDALDAGIYERALKEANEEDFANLHFFTLFSVSGLRDLTTY